MSAAGRRHLVVEADGGSRGNPGPAGFGALVRDGETGQVLAERAAYLGVTTNNVAEYSGLVAGLRAAAEIDPDAPGSSDGKAAAEAELVAVRARIRDLQERLYAERKQSLLVVLQAIDTGGKDGTIRHVFEGVNPQGCRVSSFKTPSAEELDHDFLWRYHREVPARGMIGVFNRSHYEDVLIVRVKQLVPEALWRPRYDLINDFERLLTLSGTTVLKIFLHISKDEQKERLESRLADPTKNWKFDPSDLVERQAWDSYQAASQDALTLCGTRLAPWHVVPANRKWFRNLAVGRLIAGTLEAMDPQFPEPKADLRGVTVPD